MGTFERNDYYIEPGQEWDVDLFRPDDARGVVNLFLSVYGKGYPVKTYIDPDLLIAENAARRTISTVARTPKGDVVGHNALFQSAPYKRIYESGAGVVHSDYRGGKGIFTKMVAHGQDVAAGQFHMEGIFGEAVCNHVFSQKMVFSLGWRSMAVEVDLMPASAYAAEKSASGRVSSILDFKTIKPAPHNVYLPPLYEEPLHFIYEGLDDEREIHISAESFPAGSLTKIMTQVFDFAQVARIAVSESGEDFMRAFSEEEGKARRLGVIVFQAWLNLSQPWVAEAVKILRSRGYFLGGILPRWFGDDGLFMMKITHRPRWEDMQIHFDRARKIAHFVRSDWEERGPYSF